MNSEQIPSKDFLVNHVKLIVSMCQDLYMNAAHVDHSGNFSSAKDLKKELPKIRHAVKEMEMDLVSRMVDIRNAKQKMGQVDDFDEPIDDPLES